MLELVFGNLRARPLRTLISIVGVALGVILIVLFTGLVRGISNEMTKRAANWKAEIVFTRPGSMDYTSSNASLSVTYTKRLMEIEGVDSVVPVIRNIVANPKQRFGVYQIDGVDWQPFAEMNDMKLVAGRAPAANDEIVVDERKIEEDKLSIGDSIEIYGNRPYKIVGIYTPPSGARIKMSLAALQEALQVENKCSYILVKLKDGANAEEIAATIDRTLPGNKVNLSRDLVIDAQERIPGLNLFMRVLVGLGAFVSTMFVLLSMYTTITERRREIGILKSLGASKNFIVVVIESEAFLIGVLGIFLGFIISFVSATAIQSIYGLAFEYNVNWMITAILIAVLGSLVGALYPAWRASGIDPVEVLVNE